MKLRYLVGLLLGIAYAHAADACDSMKPYLLELSSGRRPANPPEVKNCPKPDTEAVAGALVEFIAKSASATDLDAVLEQIQTAYQENDWPHAYAALAVAVPAELPEDKKVR